MNNLRRKSSQIRTMTLLFLITFATATLFVSAFGWSSDERLTTNIAYDITPSIMQTRDGTIWVIWTSDRIVFNYDLYYKTSSNYGASWSDPVRLTWHATPDQEASIIQLRDKTIWVVWSSNKSGNQEIYYKTTPSSGSWWHETVQLTNNNAEDSSPSITQNIDGTIWVVWCRNETIYDYDLFCKSSTDYGLSWTNETQLPTDVSYDMHPSITHTDNGTLWIAWTSYVVDNYEIFYMLSFNYGLSWTDPIRLTTDTAASDMTPSILQDVGGTIWVFWSKDDRIFFKTSTDYGENWSPDTLLISTTGWNKAPCATNTNDRRIWLVWESSRTGVASEIYYKISDEITPAHDIAATDILAWADRGAPLTWVPRSLPVYINVTVENQGTYDETFGVTAYADRNTGDVHVDIGTQFNIFLAAGNKTTVTLTWNTTTTPYGTYYISAEAIPLPGEYDTTDNLLINGAKIGGICVPIQSPNLRVSPSLVHLALVILALIALGTVVASFFRLLMSIKLRWPLVNH